MEQASAQPTVSTHLQAPWLLPARMLWLFGTLIALSLFIAGLPLRAREIRGLYEGSIQSGLTQKQDLGLVLDPGEGSAAVRAGVLQGDVLLAVDGMEVSSVEQAEALLRGRIGTAVTLRVRTGDFPARSLTVMRASQAGSLLLAYDLSSQFAVLFALASEILLTLLCVGLAGVIFRYRPDDWMALASALMVMVVLVGLSVPVVQSLANHVRTGTNPYWLDAWFVAAFSLLILFFYLFPTGRFTSGLTSGLGILLGMWMALGLVDRRLLPWYLPRWQYITAGVLWSLTGVAALAYRYRHSGAFQRRQIRWIVWGAGASVAGLILQLFPPLFPLPASSRLLYDFLLYPLGQVLKACLPLSIAFAILRYRLWNIEVIVNRVLVYGCLSVLTMLGYLGTIFVLEALFTGLSNPVISFIATGFVAILFEPLRRNLQRAINRWMYGERDDPYAVLARLVRTLEGTPSANEVLPSIAATVSHSLKIPYVAIWLDQEGEERLAASYGTETTALVSFPLVYQGESIGTIQVARRAPDEELSRADRHLLENITRQAGAAAQTVRLNAELIRSRAQIVNEREDERLRIRRDLHDELGPLLASQGLKLSAALKVIRSRPEKAEALVGDIIHQSQQTVADIRRLVHGLRPPALDQLGLVEAVRDAVQYGGRDMRIEVSGPEGRLSGLSAAAEVNAYRIILEAISNAAKHAKASQCTVKFGLETDLLVIQIEDDGIGLPDGYRAGVGLRSMRLRAAEIGGRLSIEPALPHGTRIIARLPFSV